MCLCIATYTDLLVNIKLHYAFYLKETSIDRACEKKCKLIILQIMF